MTSPSAATLPALLRRQAAERPDRPALCDGDRTTSYGELHRKSSQLAQALRRHGVERLERVAILDLDRDLVFVAVFAIAKAGGVVLGLNWRLTDPELAFQLEDAAVRLLFVGPELASRAAALRALCPRLRTVVVLGDAAGATAAETAAEVGLAAFCAGASTEDPGLAPHADELAVQMYTSGTTGRPKGVMLAHRSFFAVTALLEVARDPWLGWNADDVTICGMPSFHIGGLWWTMTTLDAGAALVVLDAFAGWKVLQKIERYQVTKACLVPAMIQVCLSEPDCARADLRSLGCIVYGGSPIAKPVLARALATFGCRFAQIYGLTETGNTAVCLRPEDHARDELLAAAGRPYPGVRVKAIDGEGRELPCGEIGELCIHSPANMLGYHQRPDATAATLRDGWIHTGDAGCVDAEGYVFVSDRLKDMICSAGENVYPAEVESVLAAHPAIAEIGVVGAPDERWGEIVHAVVVLRPGAQLALADLQAFARDRLADFKLPRAMSIAQSLPRTPSGKIRKAELRAPFWRGRERKV
jgi:acyl-CoA synthetase (AMP-forming)/AMP-acid ligase II